VGDFPLSRGKSPSLLFLFFLPLSRKDNTVSRFIVTNRTGSTFAYGYDRPTAQYFLDFIERHGIEHDVEALVGFGADMHPAGTNGQMLDGLAAFGLTSLIPPAHLQAIALDLPIPEGERPVYIHNGEGKPTISVEEQLKPGYVPPCPF
jgi:hypothetical protein